ncbi:putative ABC transport system ATP-binding protein [Brevibacterium siliguriense]|uniref:Putative ABC transport system ATP-binding protein n=1 Tax=Brevibacterium siliguriense TaxID=1136497 RepID=A0A1H1UQG5_9MICO|nr:ATP-binding cassette domain-containing protein [Brevibacterium siliguriense]SDS74804.1 putative ABC transport system ATP-binding protein [Brevibacterium siliguriense]
MTIELTSVGKSITEANGEVRELFSDLDFSLSGVPTSVAIMGRSGSGKTSLLRILAGLDPRYSGEYYFDGEEVGRDPLKLTRLRWNSIGYVTQHFDLLSDRSVLRNVMFGCPDRRNAKARSLESLERVGIAYLANKPVNRLSGGESQRVAIARALTKHPRVLLADEPTGALDAETEEHILTVFDDVKSAGTSIVVATHSDKVAARCDRILYLVDRQLRCD